MTTTTTTTPTLTADEVHALAEQLSPVLTAKPMWDLTFAGQWLVAGLINPAGIAKDAHKLGIFLEVCAQHAVLPA